MYPDTSQAAQPEEGAVPVAQSMQSQQSCDRHCAWCTISEIIPISPKDKLGAFRGLEINRATPLTAWPAPCQ